MDKETETYFRHLTDLFRTEGWKIITEELAADISALTHVESIKDEQELYFRKGQLFVMKNMLNLESAIEAARTEHDD